MSDYPRCATCLYFYRSHGAESGFCKGYGSSGLDQSTDFVGPSMAESQLVFSAEPTPDEEWQQAVDCKRRRLEYEQACREWLAEVKFAIPAFSHEATWLEVHETFGCVRHKERRA